MKGGGHETAVVRCEVTNMGWGDLKGLEEEEEVEEVVVVVVCGGEWVDDGVATTKRTSGQDIAVRDQFVECVRPVLLNPAK